VPRILLAVIFLVLIGGTCALLGKGIQAWRLAKVEPPEMALDERKNRPRE
jgi:hypothetical protein